MYTESMQKRATLTVNAPYDGKILGELPIQSEEEVVAALERAYALFRDQKSRLAAHERRAILARFRELIAPKVEELALAAAQEGGKPLLDSIAEVRRAIQGVEWAISELDRLAGEAIPMGSTPASQNRIALTLREPRGVVFALSAFNHPFNLIIHQVITAIAAGCPVLIKPAEATPLSCKTIVAFLEEAGLPPDWCQMIVCTHDVTAKIASDRRVAFLNFIGSAKVGWRLRSSLAPGTHCALEHGGAAPVICLSDFDLDRALPPLVKGGYYHAGQVCVSIQRLFVPRARLGEIADALTDRVSQLRVGDPTKKETEVGPLIRTREVERIHDWLSDGGEITCGGKPLSDSCYAPTVVVNPPKSARISEEEIFGPVVALYPYDLLDEAIDEANRPPFTFQAALFGKAMDPILHTVQRLDSMSVMVNDHSAFRVDWMPFGGDRDSGLGVGGIPYTINDLTREKLVILHSPAIQV